MRSRRASNNMLKNAEKHISSITGIKDGSIVINERRLLFNSTLNSFNKKSHSTLENFFKRNIKNESNIKIGNLLNVDYTGLFKKKVNIKNQELKTKWEAIDHYGPNFAHCNTCFNKNLEFFDKINPKEGINIVNYIKSIKDFEN